MPPPTHKHVCKVTVYSSPPTTFTLHCRVDSVPTTPGTTDGFLMGNSRVLSFSCSTSAALAIMDGIFLQIFLAGNTAAARFSYLTCSLARSSSGLFLDHLHPHHPRYYLKYAGISQVYLQSFLSVRVLAGSRRLTEMHNLRKA